MEGKVIKSKRYLNILLSPWMILSGILIGILIGATDKTLAARIAPFGDIYLSLLQMCILPIMISAIVSSIGRLLTTGMTSSYIRRLLLVFMTGLILTGTLGLTLGLISGPGKGIEKSARVVMGKTVFEADVNFGDAPSASSGLLSFFRTMVPQNIFKALTEGQNLAVLFFSILIGIALGISRSSASNTTLSVIDSLYEAFQKIIGWIMYGLPFGLTCLLADQISKVGMAMMIALLKFIILMYCGALILVIVYSIIIWARVRGSYISSLLALKDTLMVALGTSSSFASIPSALQGLHKGLRIEKQSADLVIPLGISFNPQGSVVYFVIASIFMAQIYDLSLGPREIAITFFGSIFAAMAAAGAPGIGGLSMISLVMDPLGLPTSVAVILLAAIDPIVDPIVTAANVYGNCASTALIAKKPAIGE